MEYHQSNAHVVRTQLHTRANLFNPSWKKNAWNYIFVLNVCIACRSSVDCINIFSDDWRIVPIWAHAFRYTACAAANWWLFCYCSELDWLQFRAQSAQASAWRVWFQYFHCPRTLTAQFSTSSPQFFGSSGVGEKNRFCHVEFNSLFFASLLVRLMYLWCCH